MSDVSYHSYGNPTIICDSIGSFYGKNPTSKIVGGEQVTISNLKLHQYLELIYNAMIDDRDLHVKYKSTGYELLREIREKIHCHFYIYCDWKF